MWGRANRYERGKEIFMTRSFTSRRSAIIAALTAAVVAVLLGAFVLKGPHAAAQDDGLADCGIACQIVPDGGDGSIYVAPPPFPDLVGPDHIDDAYVAPTPTLPPYDPSTDPYVVDTDGDGVPDGYEGVDSDNDGVWDWYEIYVYGTDPLTADQPNRSEGGSEAIPPDESSEEDCTYATPDTCFPRHKPDDEKRE
jgi:hypothetical protein